MKIPKIEKLPSGNFFCRLRIDGKSIPITGAKKSEVEQKAYAIKSGYLSEPSRCDVTPFQAVNRYLLVRENILSPSTLRSYRVMQNTRFERFAHKLCSSVDWQKAINEEAKLVSPKTLKNAWSLFRSALIECGVEVPRVKLPQIVREERRVLDADQIPKFVNAVKDTHIAIPSLLALSSLRMSEIFGLTWDKVDLKNGTIRVQGAMVRGEDGLVYKKTNKTSESARTIPIMIPALRDALESAKQKEGYVYPHHPSNLSPQISKVCRDAGLPELKCHELRHSFASLCYHLNIPPMVCQKLGGWSDTKTMQDIYTHIYEKDVAKAAQGITDFFSNCQ